MHILFLKSRASRAKRGQQSPYFCPIFRKTLIYAHPPGGGLSAKIFTFAWTGCSTWLALGLVRILASERDMGFNFGLKRCAFADLQGIL